MRESVGTYVPHIFYLVPAKAFNFSGLGGLSRRNLENRREFRSNLRNPYGSHRLDSASASKPSEPRQ